MLPNRYGRSYEKLPRANRAALEAVASVIVGHLQAELSMRPSEEAAPLLIQVDGPGDGDLVELVADHLHEAQANPRWTVIRFDAWQYQRVKPPWWWLITAVDRQLRLEFNNRGRGVARRKRLLDYLWRVGELLKDLVPILPVIALGAGLWYLTGQLAMDEFLKWAAGVVGAVVALGAAFWSASNALRRLLVASPMNAGATVGASDPMADFQRRYSFLIRSAETPVALLIDNLDRCRADYIVELLEGIQTLLKSPAPEMQPTPLVAVFVAAERRWICESYVHVYEEFQESAREPGRPFGLAFVDKVFDFVLELPTVPAAASMDDESDAEIQVSHQIRTATSELVIRTLVAAAERDRAEGTGVTRPLYALRVNAVERLGELEVQSDERMCFDTARHLEALVDKVGANPAVLEQLRTAYCVHRTGQLLGGHLIDDDPDAIHRLGLWTMLDVRWPILRQRLAEHPHEVEDLRARRVPEGVGEELQPVFTRSDAPQLVHAWQDAELTPSVIRRFSAAPADSIAVTDVEARSEHFAEHG